jgi:hypothetical protein
LQGLWNAEIFDANGSRRQACTQLAATMLGMTTAKRGLSPRANLKG